MSKVLIIPDVHLKTWLFEKADQILNETQYDKIVCLGDIVDDWNQQYNQKLYIETLDTLIAFAKKHNNFIFCYGNHDMSYFWRRLESGYSPIMESIVTQKLSDFKRHISAENVGYIHRIDNVLFSHAGLTNWFVEEYIPDAPNDIDDLLRQINEMGAEEMWTDVSPLWARPQDGILSMYAPDMLQVVGHTPVEVPEQVGNLLTLDTFSTYPNNRPIGNQKFVVIDTVEKTWEYV